MAQLVEHHLAKVRVAGSSPVFRSISLPTARPPDQRVAYIAPYGQELYGQSDTWMRAAACP